MRPTLFLLIFFVFNSCSNHKLDQKTEVTVLGTVHFPTQFVNSDSIYNILVTVNPDIIAIEADSSVFNADFSFKKTYDENEYNAVLKYIKTNPLIEIRPIGFEGRNAYRKKIGIYPEAGFVYNAMYDLLDAEKLTNEHSDMLLHYENLWAVMEVFKNETLTNINHPFVDRLIDSINKYQYVKTEAIVNTRQEFDYKILGADKDSVSLRTYFKKWIDFEGVQRNQALANNLKKVITEFPEKRIIALTGFKHRSYLLNALKKEKNDLKIELIEFYDYQDTIN